MIERPPSIVTSSAVALAMPGGMMEREVGNIASKSSLLHSWSKKAQLESVWADSLRTNRTGIGIRMTIIIAERKEL